MQEFVENLMERLHFPVEARMAFRAADTAVGRLPSARQEMAAAQAALFTGLDDESVNRLLGDLTSLAHRAGVHPYTLHLLFYMEASQGLLARYRAGGFSEDVFWDTTTDLSCKLKECHEVYGIWGTFVAGWHADFFRMKRFGLGRLQFEIAAFDRPDYMRDGFTVRRGERVYSLHIPSSGPLTRESCLDAYRRAYAFFRPDREDRPLWLMCISWLLFPDNEQFFPRPSHILDFAHDFDIIDRHPLPTFSDGWRVFGGEWRKPPEQLPRRTSLQRAYVTWLQNGGQTGYGVGMLCFDGRRIL